MAAMLDLTLVVESALKKDDSTAELKAEKKVVLMAVLLVVLLVSKMVAY